MKVVCVPFELGIPGLLFLSQPLRRSLLGASGQRGVSGGEARSGVCSN